MDLRARLAAALKEAVRTRDDDRLLTLRLINAAVRDRDLARRAEARDAGASEAEVLAILERMVRQREASARAYDEGGRLDMAEQERRERQVIEGFLPRQLDAVEVEGAIRSAVAETGADGLRDVGRVMAALKARYPGQMDFCRVAPLVKARLTG